MTSTQAIRNEREQLLEAEQRRRAKAEEMKRNFQTPIPGPIGDADIFKDRLKNLKPRIRPEDDANRDELIRHLIRDANIPALHAKRTEFGGEAWHETFGKVVSKLGSGFVMALIGLRGAGKTQLGAVVITENINRLKSARFTTAMDIFLAIKATYRRDSETDERAIVEDFCKPRLLVIDEIQERAESPWEDRILTHLINRRYNDEKDTLIIGNITPEQFAGVMGASVISRLNETGGIISCEWESFRK